MDRGITAATERAIRPAYIVFIVAFGMFALICASSALASCSRKEAMLRGAAARIIDIPVEAQSADANQEVRDIDRLQVLNSSIADEDCMELPKADQQLMQLVQRAANDTNIRLPSELPLNNDSLSDQVSAAIDVTSTGDCRCYARHAAAKALIESVADVQVIWTSRESTLVGRVAEALWKYYDGEAVNIAQYAITLGPISQDAAERFARTMDVALKKWCGYGLNDDWPAPTGCRYVTEDQTPSEVRRSTRPLFEGIAKYPSVGYRSGVRLK